MKSQCSRNILRNKSQFIVDKAESPNPKPKASLDTGEVISVFKALERYIVKYSLNEQIN